MTVSLEQAAAKAAAVGIALRGAFHPEAGDGVPLLPGGTPAVTLVLADAIDISRGDMLVHRNASPASRQNA